LIEGEKGKKKKKRKRRKKRRRRKNTSCRPRSCAVVARVSPASCRRPRSRFFSRTGRKIEATLVPNLGERNPYSVPRVDLPQGSKSIGLLLGLYHLVSEQRSCCPCSRHPRLHLTKQFPQLLRHAPPPSTPAADQINLPLSPAFDLEI
ncbi:hypothetical protein BHM03_00040427, partial [Ensete ventricosum]